MRSNLLKPGFLLALGLLAAPARADKVLTNQSSHAVQIVLHAASAKDCTLSMDLTLKGPEPIHAWQGPEEEYKAPVRAPRLMRLDFSKVGQCFLNYVYQLEPGATLRFSVDKGVLAPAVNHEISFKVVPGHVADPGFQAEPAAGHWVTYQVAGDAEGVPQESLSHRFVESKEASFDAVQESFVVAVPSPEKPGLNLVDPPKHGCCVIL